MIDRLRAKRTDSGKLLAGSTVRGCVTATSALLRFGVRRGHLDTSAKRNVEPRY